GRLPGGGRVHCWARGRGRVLGAFNDASSPALVVGPAYARVASPPMKRLEFSPLASAVSRRHFIGRLSLGAAGLAFGSRLRAADAPAKKFGVALVGLGNYSTGQLGPALKVTKNCQLAGVVTGD